MGNPSRVLEEYGNMAKLAYLDSRPVGLIQYRLNPEERLVEIDCIFVPEKQHHRKGIGKSLLEALIKDVKKPEPAFGNDIPHALVTHAFEAPGWYPQHKFYQRMGFKRVKEDNPFLLYYPQERVCACSQRGEVYPSGRGQRKSINFLQSVMSLVHLLL